MKTPKSIWVNLKKPTRMMSIETAEPETSYKSFTSKKEGLSEYISIEEHNKILKTKR